MAVAASALLFSSCGSLGTVGSVFTNTVEPVAATSNTFGTKVGTAEVKSFVGVVAIGDGGIHEAAKNGGIKKISHIDVKTFSVMGVYTCKTYFVYGE